MTLDSRDASTLERLTLDCRRAFGERLRALALYGEAATAAYRAGTSRLDTVVLLDRVAVSDLAALRRCTERWFRRRVPTPLVVDETYLATSRDVFPLELLELRDRHRMLAGHGDPLAALEPPSLPHLRLEIEQQLKGKLLHLRESYVALGAGRGLPALLVAARDTLDVLLRGVLALAERPRPVAAGDVIEAVAALHGVDLAGVVQLERWWGGAARLDGDDAERLFHAVHDELAVLAHVVDRA